MSWRDLFAGLLFFLVVLDGVVGQRVDTASYERVPHSILLGTQVREFGNLIAADYEWMLGRNLSVNPSIGIGLRGNSFFLNSWENGRFWKYAGTLRLKWYFLLRKGRKLQGIYGLMHGAYFRGTIRKQPEDYHFFRIHQSEIGIGLGGQIRLWKRFLIGASAALAWVRGANWFGNPDGTTLFTHPREGLSPILSVYTGISF